MRLILFGILALSALIVVSALGALPGAYAQGGGKSQGSVPQAPVGHRQPTTRDVPDIQWKKWRTGLVRQMQTLYREVHGRDGSLTQIEKWTAH